jgi:hypothetical protein
MKTRIASALVASAITLMSSVVVSPTLAGAQAIGNDAVYNSSNTVTFSPSFIDASMLLPPNSTLGRDLCDAIYRLLSGFSGFPPYPSAGAVIDARGCQRRNQPDLQPWQPVDGGHHGRPVVNDPAARDDRCHTYRHFLEVDLAKLHAPSRPGRRH